jgi:putative transposase
LHRESGATLGTDVKRSTLKGLNPSRQPHNLRSVAQSLAKILLHVVFSTKDRQPFLRDKLLREALHRYLGGILENLDCQPLMIGGVEDHIHALFVLSRTAVTADAIKELKRSSSVWLKRRSPELASFAWQSGYGAFSIGFSQVDAVRSYIVRQEEHHRKTSFQEEYRELLSRYEIAYDERYVWD